MRKFLLVALLVGISSNAMAKWDKFSSSKDGMRTNYIDHASIHKETHIVYLSSLIDFKEAQRVEESSSPMFYKSIEKQLSFDCKNMQYRMTAYSYYSENLGEGEIVIGNSHLSNPDWEKVAPDSTEKLLGDIACAKH